MVVILPYCIKAKRCEHNALGYWSGLALCLTKVRSSRARCPATALINLGIEIQCVSEHVWVGGSGLRSRGGELPAGGIRASQGTFSSIMLTPLTDTPVQNLLIKCMLQNVKKICLVRRHPFF